MDEPVGSGTFPASMKPKPLAVAFREVRHFKPDDWLHCEDVAVRAEEMAWTIPAHRHEALHQFQFLQHGQAEATFDGVPQCLRAPALLMVAPGCVHAFRYQPGSVGRQVTVPSAHLATMLAAAPALAALVGTTQVLQGDPMKAGARRVAALCAALNDELEGFAPGRTEALQAHLVLLVTWLLRRVAPPPPDEARHALRDTLLQRYRALVELHLRQQRPLGFYARELKVTPDHLSRVCRALTGQSALELLHERVLVAARRLLAYTDAPVTDVAAELGFADPAYFSRFFSRRAGLSPQAYRAALLDGTAVRPEQG
jgi:AraC family transcriptional regulator, transcriptional activator of pobA